ncbi:MAG: asparagine synthase B, partial [Verrucomicrobiaceae bacterium]
MCGIVGVFDLKKKAEDLRPQALNMSRRQRHRGPDWSGIFVCEQSILVHERLSIVDPTSGKQPLLNGDGSLALAVNGEIYNHRELKKGLRNPYTFQTQSDCEVILALYQEKGTDFLEDLNGIFAFALYNHNDNTYLIARDHMGIIPLYMGWDEWGTFYVASELKALAGVCTKIQEFPPGHYLDSRTGTPVKWYNREWTDYDAVKDADAVVLVTEWDEFRA